jgi:C-terminal processing protease CtpA/Prc
MTTRNPHPLRLVGGIVGSLVLLGGLGLIAFGWARLGELERENQALRGTRELVGQLRAENQELEKLSVDHDELERLRKETQEIHKLRAQYQELQRLRGEFTALQQENARLKAASQPSVAPGVVRPPDRVPAPGASLPPPSVWIGVSMQMQPGSAAGVVVQDVVANGPAANSGLVAGDVIMAVDGRPVTSPQQLRAEIGTRSPGQNVTLDVTRDGNSFRVGITVAAYPK